MLNDPNIRNTFVPLLLRLTLAAIFLYHGVSKVGGSGNDWGVAWATNMWQRQEGIPKAPMAELDKGLKDLQAEEASLKKAGEGLAGTEKDENAKKLEENATKQYEFRVAEDRIARAFAAASPPLPGALTDQWVQLAVAWGELLCGAAMLVGLFTRVAAVGLVVIMAGAIYTVTWAHGFSNPAGGGGYEYNLAILAMCAVLVIKGAGPLSLDGWLASRGKAPKQNQQPVAV
jgi:putative oxidoreductase